jgi:hypothetical protein
VTDFASYSCGDFGDSNPPADCTPGGSRPTGAACAFNGQCASAYCSKNKNAACGTCDVAPAAGDACDSSNCGHDQVCVVDATANTTLCQVRGTLNSACSTDLPCGTGLSCVGSTATATGTCQNALSTAGAACGGTMPGCDGNAGFRCGGPAGSKTCMVIAIVGDGMPCGSLSDGSFAQCQQGDCYTATGLASGGQMGTCQTDAADGAPCDTQLGPGCTPPAKCVLSGTTSTSGICTVPLGSTCN